MRSYYITEGSGAKSKIIPILGLVKSGEEVIMISILRGKKNRSVVNDLLNKSKLYTIYRSMGHYRETEGDIRLVSGKLQFFNVQKTNSFANAEIITYVNMELMQKTALLSAEGDKAEIEIEETIIKMINEQSPLPLPSDESTVKNVVSSLRNLTKNAQVFYSTEAFPYRNAVVLDINSPEAIEAISHNMIVSYGETQFVKAFKRAPRVKSLMYMINPEKSFSMKTWPKVMNFFGGKEDFEKMNLEYQKNIIWAYEVFGEKTIDIFEVLKKKGLSFDYIPFKTLSIAKIKTADFKIDLNLFVKILKELDEGIMIYSLVSSLEESEFRNNFKNIAKSKSTLLTELSKKQYTNMRQGGEPIAIVAAELGISQNHFETYQDEYIKAMEKLPFEARTYPTISGKLEGSDYAWESMDMGNPRAWFVGLETNCCQHLHSLGGECVRYAAKNPKYSGILRITKKGKTIAQSFFWFHQESGDFVMDNIEVLGGELRDSILTCYNLFIDELEKRKDIFGIKRVSFGGGYSDINVSNFEKLSDNVKLSNMPNGHGVYTDANIQYLLRKF